MQTAKPSPILDQTKSLDFIDLRSLIVEARRRRLDAFVFCGGGRGSEGPGQGRVEADFCSKRTICHSSNILAANKQIVLGLKISDSYVCYRETTREPTYYILILATESLAFRM